MGLAGGKRGLQPGGVAGLIVEDIAVVMVDRVPLFSHDCPVLGGREERIHAGRRRGSGVLPDRFQFLL